MTFWAYSSSFRTWPLLGGTPSPKLSGSAGKHTAPASPPHLPSHAFSHSRPPYPRPLDVLVLTPKGWKDGAPAGRGHTGRPRFLQSCRLLSVSRTGFSPGHRGVEEGSGGFRTWNSNALCPQETVVSHNPPLVSLTVAEV